jgi:hypothetical protein
MMSLLGDEVSRERFLRFLLAAVARLERLKECQCVSKCLSLPSVIRKVGQEKARKFLALSLILRRLQLKVEDTVRSASSSCID